jgi:ATP-dependent Clp protease ATP-binding subunit ClpX
MTHASSLKTLNRLSKFYSDLNEKDFFKEIQNLITAEDKWEVLEYKFDLTNEELRSKLQPNSRKIDGKSHIYAYEVRLILDELNVVFVAEDELDPNENVLTYKGPFLKEEFEIEFFLEFFRYSYGTFSQKIATSKQEKTVEEFKKLSDRVSSLVIGQQGPIREAIAAYKMFEAVCEVNRGSKLKTKKTSILLQGGSGTGKTYMLETLAKELNIPFITFDTSRLTSEGYVGMDVDDIVDAYLKAMNEFGKESRAIIFLDEIDKLAQGGSNGGNDVGTFGAQRNLLKLLESDVHIMQASQKRNTSGGLIDLSQVMFVFAGSFSDFVKQSKDQKDSIGFGKPKDKKIKAKLTEADLIEAGLIPELVGRIGQVIQLNDLTEKDLKFILDGGKNSYLKQYKLIGNEMGINVKFDKEEIEEMLKESAKLELGARGLKTIADKRFTQKINEVIYND